MSLLFPPPRTRTLKRDGEQDQGDTGNGVGYVSWRVGIVDGRLVAVDVAVRECVPRECLGGKGSWHFVERVPFGRVGFA